jgi:TrmH family RNA methyltransferase
MKPILEITSLQNPKIKSASKLIDPRDRDQTGLFLIEGYRELKRAGRQRLQDHNFIYLPGAVSWR